MTRRRLTVLMVSTALAALVTLTAPPPARAVDINCLFAPALCTAGEVVETAGDAVGAAASSLVEAAAEDFGRAAATVLKETFGWWLRTPTVSIEGSGVLLMQGVMLGLAAIAGVLLVIVQGLRMVITRRGTPLVELVQGVLVAGVVTAAGVAIVDAMLVAGDELARYILSAGFPSSDQLVERMVAVLFGPAMAGTPGLLFVFALVVLLIGLLQAVMLFLRQAAIPLLALMFPLVAVGQLGPASTRKWLPAVGAAVIAIVLYKPLVALVLTAGFAQIAEGTTLLDVVRGFVTLALSVIALPAMLRIFAPIVGSVAASSSGGGAALLGAAGTLATLAALRGHGTPGDTDASSHARFMETRDGGAGPSGPGGSAGQPGTGGGPGPTAPPAPAAETAATQAHHVAGATAAGPATTAAPAATASTAAASGAAATGVGVPVAVALKGVELGQAAGQAAGEQVAAGSDR